MAWLESPTSPSPAQPCLIFRGYDSVDYFSRGDNSVPGAGRGQSGALGGPERQTAAAQSPLQNLQLLIPHTRSVSASDD